MRPLGTRARRGTTLVELLVALTMLAVLVAATADVVARQWRTQGALDARRAARAQLAAAADALRPALRMAAGDGGAVDSSDFLFVSDTLLELRTALGASVVCAVAGPTTVELPPLSSASPSLTWWRAAPQPGDVALVFSDDSLGGAWRTLPVAALGTSAAGCAGSSLVSASDPQPRHRLTLAAALPAGVVPGTPIRFARRVRWLHYRASDGRWYLGEREWDGTAWTGTQPVAGPLRPPGARGGLAMRALDSTGSALNGAAAATARVVRVDVVVRADVTPLAGARAASAVDSVAFVVAPRNGG